MWKTPQTPTPPAAHSVNKPSSGCHFTRVPRHTRPRAAASCRSRCLLGGKGQPPRPPSRPAAPGCRGQHPSALRGIPARPGHSCGGSPSKALPGRRPQPGGTASSDSITWLHTSSHGVSAEQGLGTAERRCCSSSLLHFFSSLSAHGRLLTHRDIYSSPQHRVPVTQTLTLVVSDNQC